MSCNNTNSTCSNCSYNYSSCNNQCTKCGCKDSFLTSPPPCPTPAGCPDPIPCQEVLSSDCIIYSGPDLSCNGDIVVYSDSTWTELLENIVEYFCLPPIPELTCNGDVVVQEDSSISDALEDIVDYFCTEIANTGVRKFVKEFTDVVFDGQILTITGAELTTCGLLTDACGNPTNRFSDFTFNIMYLLSGVWYGLTNETGVSVRANDTTGNISVILNITPIDPGVTVRVIIIG
jgi:hypothetical protein